MEGNFFLKKLRKGYQLSFLVIGIFVCSFTAGLVQAGPFILDPGPGGDDPPPPNWVQKRYWKIDLASYSIFTETPSEGDYRLRLSEWEYYDTVNREFKVHYRIQCYYWWDLDEWEGKCAQFDDDEYTTIFPRVRKLTILYDQWACIHTSDAYTFTTEGDLKKQSLEIERDYTHAGSTTFGSLEVGLEVAIFETSSGWDHSYGLDLGTCMLVGGTLVIRPTLYPSSSYYWPNDYPNGVVSTSIPGYYLGYYGAQINASPNDPDDDFDKYFCSFSQWFQPRGSIILPPNAWFVSGANIYVN